MKIIVVGCGEVGRNIAQHLVSEDHDVVVVDHNAEQLAQISDHIDVKTVYGRGSLPSVLEEAGAKDADMLIAVTKSDEINMVACQMAYSLFGIAKKIARVSDASYLSLADSHLYSPENMPVDVIISPEVEVAEAIFRTMFVPGAFDAYGFGDDEALMVGMHVAEDAPLQNKPLAAWAEEDVPMRLLAIYRGEELIIPSQSDHLEQGDEVYFVARQEDVERCMQFLGVKEPPLKKAFVIGGGRVGFSLAQRLENQNIHTRVLESNTKRADRLAEDLSNATILCGDALDRKLLTQENLGDMDIVLSVTSDDAANILSSVLAQQLGAKNVMTLVTQATFFSLSENIGLEKTISPREVTVSRILQHVRKGVTRSVHTIRNKQAEVLEIQVLPDSKLVGMNLRDVELPEGTMLGCIVRRSGEVVMNDGEAVLQAGDYGVIFAASDSIHDVEDLF